MYKSFLLALCFIFLAVGSVEASPYSALNYAKAKLDMDTSRLAELDQYWQEVGRTVSEGDFEGYSALYHEDAVVIFATGENKRSMSIARALVRWEGDFEATKSGKANSNVIFRLSQRINDEETAHETGIFKYSAVGDDGKDSGSYVHFEMLLVKRRGSGWA